MKGFLSVNSAHLCNLFFESFTVWSMFCMSAILRCDFADHVGINQETPITSFQHHQYLRAFQIKAENQHAHELMVDIDYVA